MDLIPTEKNESREKCTVYIILLPVNVKKIRIIASQESGRARLHEETYPPERSYSKEVAAGAATAREQKATPSKTAETADGIRVRPGYPWMLICVEYSKSACSRPHFLVICIVQPSCSTALLLRQRHLREGS